MKQLNLYKYTTYGLVISLAVVVGYVVFLNQEQEVKADFYDPSGQAETQPGQPWYIPESFVKGEFQKDGGVRLADVNGDGLPDILQTYGGGSALHLNNGSGWNTTGLNVPSGLYESRTRLADVNGDGLIDILVAEDALRDVLINNGSNAWVDSPSWTIPVPFVAAQKDNGVQLADVNGDGLVDILWALEAIGNNPPHNELYLNNGTGWVAVP